ncbi:hypothetical protein Pgin04_00297 [Porphyromonas gingivalis]
MRRQLCFILWINRKEAYVIESFWIQMKNNSYLTLGWN